MCPSQCRCLSFPSPAGGAPSMGICTCMARPASSSSLRSACFTLSTVPRVNLVSIFNLWHVCATMVNIALWSGADLMCSLCRQRQSPQIGRMQMIREGSELPDLMLWAHLLLPVRPRSTLNSFFCVTFCLYFQFMSMGMTGVPGMLIIVCSNGVFNRLLRQRICFLLYLLTRSSCIRTIAKPPDNCGARLRGSESLSHTNESKGTSHYFRVLLNLTMI